MSSWMASESAAQRKARIDWVDQYVLEHGHAPFAREIEAFERRYSRPILHIKAGA